MKTGIVTIKRRTTDYIHTMLESFVETGGRIEDVEAFCGDSNTEYLSKYPFRFVHCLPDIVKANHGSQVNSTSNHANATLNCNLILEDDVTFRSGWKNHLDAAIEEARYLRPDGHFMLTLWSSYEKWPRGAPILPLPFENYHGSMGIYVPDELRFDVFRHMVERLPTEPPDVAYASYCKVHGIPLYLVNPFPLVHIGVESAIRV